MRLVRLATNRDGAEQETWGVEEDGTVRDVGSLLATCPTLMDAIEQWDSLASQLPSLIADAPVLDSSCKILTPVRSGGKIICIGLNYRDHALETGAQIPTEPVVFNKLPGTLCNPGEAIPLPQVSNEVDYEAELVVVIGKRAWQVREEEAEQYIFGYTCGHDVSARDWQRGRPGGQWLLGKSFPKFAPLGPYLIPQADIADPCNLRITMKINGETLQDSNTSQLIFRPAALIAYMTRCFVLEPGDVIYTGTPSGVGMARAPQRFLRPGDQCEVTIEGLGSLVNPVVQG
ncbi:MAG: hypothetical protein KatS3mg111_3535 [Pirellulaceae bacterium]|nr:MAG: hypothetical protein KatS3mg111_3535 [Pirellulaceae bacterium]